MAITQITQSALAGFANAWSVEDFKRYFCLITGLKLCVCEIGVLVVFYWRKLNSWVSEYARLVDSWVKLKLSLTSLSHLPHTLSLKLSSKHTFQILNTSWIGLSIHAHLMTSQWRHQVLGEILLFWLFSCFWKNGTTYQIQTLQAA